MATRRVRFYLDENLSPEIAVQLTVHGIDVIRGPLRESDWFHLQRASALGRVLCTQDTDLLKLSKIVDQHAGIIFGYETKHNVGEWVKFLRLVHGAGTPDEMRNTVTHVFRVD